MVERRVLNIRYNFYTVFSNDFLGLAQFRIILSLIKFGPKLCPLKTNAIRGRTDKNIKGFLGLPVGPKMVFWGPESEDISQLRLFLIYYNCDSLFFLQGSTLTRVKRVFVNSKPKYHFIMCCFYDRSLNILTKRNIFSLLK